MSSDKLDGLQNRRNMHSGGKNMGESRARRPSGRGAFSPPHLCPPSRAGYFKTCLIRKRKSEMSGAMVGKKKKKTHTFHLLRHWDKQINNRWYCKERTSPWKQFRRDPITQIKSTLFNQQRKGRIIPTLCFEKKKKKDFFSPHPFLFECCQWWK